MLQPLAFVLALLVLDGPAVQASPPDRDTDGDGLSDFREVHKYCTDPRKADSDGDGKPDGDWEERREYTYTIRTVVQVMPPVSEDAVSDDYQDARVRGRGAEYVELEVVHYPLNTVAQTIRGTTDWRDRPDALRRYLDPGPTTNWDAEMRLDMGIALADAGIEPASLTDRETVERVSRWLMERAERLNSSSFDIRFRDGKPEVLPIKEDDFRRIMHKPGGTIGEQFQHELYGRGMYFNRTTGSCTSAANYLTTGLRAIGIPARMVRAIPLVDASDPAQVAMVREGIRLPALREQIVGDLEQLGQSFAGHTYNEVYVGGHWHRLNYDRLGQNILGGGMGVLTTVQVYGDLAEARLADTWGVWTAGDGSGSVFEHANPYRALEVDDAFGEHGELRPGERREHKRLTITRVYWANGPEAPDFVRDAGLSAGAFLGHVAEWFAEEPDGDQIKRFTGRADPAFELRAAGRPTLRASVRVGTVSSTDGALREVLFELDGADRERMPRGVEYTLHPANGKAGHRWLVTEEVRLVR